jgi:hypothetical protein
MSTVVLDVETDPGGKETEHDGQEPALTQVRATNTSNTYESANPARRIAVFAYICQQSRSRRPVRQSLATRAEERWNAVSRPKVSSGRRRGPGERALWGTSVFSATVILSSTKLEGASAKECRSSTRGRSGHRPARRARVARTPTAPTGMIGSTPGLGGALRSDGGSSRVIPRLQAHFRLAICAKDRPRCQSSKSVSPVRTLASYAGRRRTGRPRLPWSGQTEP